ncbi:MULTISPECIES: hypothetical protein [Paraburkholderia]|uniref:hypothetical protein n=1 Tax=Paraburkholderia TaxID=1822464 RepID=UPI0038BD942F
MSATIIHASARRGNAGDAAVQIVDHRADRQQREDAEAGARSTRADAGVDCSDA